MDELPEIVTYHPPVIPTTSPSYFRVIYDGDIYTFYNTLVAIKLDNTNYTIQKH